jgi:hypothetical protein
LILPAFIVAYFAIIPSAPAQQQPGLEVIAEYNGTVLQPAKPKWLLALKDS